ncbi:L-glutamate gamma-semialdehyde dehydrogenase [Proteinivorax tanatarense]|uniref:L-glutamate gamma-semialdehyde dehydrogenase n=1 Tax=Proteinivorax tanatarense TaxID=1260629 RepID=A0AAU7VJN6_9FIRM
MIDNLFSFKRPSNEMPNDFKVNSVERKELKFKLEEYSKKVIEIPLIINGKEVRTGDMGEVRMPHNHKHILANYHKAGEKEISMAVEASREAKKEWENMPWQMRALVFKKAAALIAGPYRQVMNAVTMLGQSKNAYQAEIEAVCELVDFFEFNTHYISKMYKEQPDSTRTVINQLDYRPLEGFVFAVTPFNFTAIGGNLPSAPAMVGNTVVWKPALTAVYSNYFVMKILQEAGLPSGVINFIPGDGAKVADVVLKKDDLAGIHFTGSTTVFNSMWKKVAQNLEKYKTYPKIVGETGGKDFVVVHPSADNNEVVTGLIRGAYEYQGQKCSAASRAYIPESKWAEIKNSLIKEVKNIKVGPVEEFSNFVNAVIDQKAFDKIENYIDYARKSPEAEIIAGGTCDDTKGYFISPTLILTENPKFKTMVEEIFGPVLTIFVYPDDEFEQTLKLVNETSPYGLTGSIFAKDRQAQLKAIKELRQAAGNFYVNDKPTTAIVGQQPFGGARASGTNDKAGAEQNLSRWISPRVVKETLVPAKDYKYPFMDE